uniref:Uncharacterized protein n=1 Tax=Anguilla anguilla TaxID=7936 RepID=A0A0E9PII9_ANGAN
MHQLSELFPLRSDALVIRKFHSSEGFLFQAADFIGHGQLQPSLIILNYRLQTDYFRP